MDTATYLIYDLPDDYWQALTYGTRAKIEVVDGLEYITVVDSHKKPRRALSRHVAQQRR